MTDQNKDKPNLIVQPIGRRETPAESLEGYMEVWKGHSDLKDEKHKHQFSEEEAQDVGKMVARSLTCFVSPKRDQMVQPKDPTTVADQLAPKPYTPESTNAIRRAMRNCSPKLSREVREWRESIVREITGHIDPKVRQTSFATNPAPQKSIEEILEDSKTVYQQIVAEKDAVQKRWQRIRPKFWAVLKGCHSVEGLSEESQKRLADMYAFSRGIDAGTQVPSMNMLDELEKFLDQYVVKVDSKDQA